MKERNYFIKLVIFIVLIFIILLTKFSADDIFSVTFKVIFFIIILFLIGMGIAILSFIHKIKQYKKISEDMEREYREFFENLFEEEFKYYEKSKYANTNNDEKFNNKHYHYSNINNSELGNALRLFKYNSVEEIEAGELKKKYRILIKQAHPDNGGSVERTQIVNEYYKILSNYAN